jgi:hypothetical protein
MPKVRLPIKDVLPQVSAGWNGYRFQTTIDSKVLEAIVNLIPEEWLQWEESNTAAELRDVYLQFY